MGAFSWPDQYLPAGQFFFQTAAFHRGISRNNQFVVLYFILNATLFHKRTDDIGAELAGCW